MKEESVALENNGTWTLNTLSPDKCTLGCKYRIKYKTDGTIERYKAQLVILGNIQTEGIDFTETFAPVTKMVTIWILLFVASTCNWPVY